MLGLVPEVGLGPCGTTEDDARRYEVEGEDEVNGCIECPDRRRAVIAAPDAADEGEC